MKKRPGKTKPARKSASPMGGRPAHKPTKTSRHIALVLSGFGIPQTNIAAVLEITAPTLREHYAAELSRGTASVEAKMVNNLVRLSGGKDGTALKATLAILQMRFGWSIYAPRAPQDAPAVAQPGKKEQADIDAREAHVDTPWSGLVN